MDKEIFIDSTIGGKGDIWMRLVSFYVASKLINNYRFVVRVPVHMESIAISVFGDRLKFINHGDFKFNYCYTHLGIKSLIVPLLRGKRFISPYQKSVINDKKRELKDYANILIFDLLNFLNLVKVPQKKWITSYQGYLEIIAINEVSYINYENYLKQLSADYPLIWANCHSRLTLAEDSQTLSSVKDKIIVFPTGTGRQFIPVWWCVKYLPNAYYIFYKDDKEAKLYEDAKLHILYFNKPEDIVRLGMKAKWSISTDSFPSHLLQYSVSNCTVLITGTLKSRIISPFFKGKVVNATAPCHPCLHMARNLHPLCAAGYQECVNWHDKKYTSDILNSLPT